MPLSSPIDGQISKSLSTSNRPMETIHDSLEQVIRAGKALIECPKTTLLAEGKCASFVARYAMTPFVEGSFMDFQNRQRCHVERCRVSWATMHLLTVLRA